MKYIFIFRLPLRLFSKFVKSSINAKNCTRLTLFYLLNKFSICHECSRFSAFHSMFTLIVIIGQRVCFSLNIQRCSLHPARSLAHFKVPIAQLFRGINRDYVASCVVCLVSCRHSNWYVISYWLKAHKIRALYVYRILHAMWAASKITHTRSCGVNWVKLNALCIQILYIVGFFRTPKGHRCAKNRSHTHSMKLE